MPSPLPDSVRLAASRGNKIEAIRLLREQTGLGLSAAKGAVESGLVPEPGAPWPPNPGLPPEVAAALAEGNKVKAIKLLRESSGLNLKQAKAVAEEAQRQLAQAAPVRHAGLSPGEVPRRRLSSSFVLTLVVIVALVAWVLVRQG